MQNFLRQGAPPHCTQHLHRPTFTPRKKKACNLEFLAHQSPIFLFKWALPSCYTQIIYTYKFKLLKGLKLCILRHLLQIFLHKGGAAFGPYQGICPWTPPGALWVGLVPTREFFALCVLCFSLQFLKVGNPD